MAKPTGAAGLAAALLLLAGAAGSADAAASRFLINRVNVLQPLTALGTEPFWGVDISARGIVWSDPDLQNVRGPWHRPKTSPGKAVWTTRLPDGRALVVTATRGPCSDGMSERTWPLTVRARIGADVTFSGCGATKDALARFGNRETGEVR